MSALVSIRSILTDVQEREAGAYEQVKQAVQVAEEANFEKTKASLRRSKLRQPVTALFSPPSIPVAVHP